MSSHTISHADSIYRGDVYKKGTNADGRRGILWAPVASYNCTPATLDRNGISLAQQTAGAANLTITGALASGGVATLDVPRNITVYSAGNISTVVFTITGKDQYGDTIVETITGVNNSTVEGDKAFKTVSQIAASGAVGTDVEVGSGDTFGIPYRVNDKGQIITISWDSGLEDLGVFTVADATTATATTGDVRGTVNTSSASNGSRELYVIFLMNDTTTPALVYGVDQYDG